VFRGAKLSKEGEVGHKSLNHVMNGRKNKVQDVGRERKRHLAPGRHAYLVQPRSRGGSAGFETLRRWRKERIGKK